MAAVDQAVADGVDVINYSVSGSQTNFLDPVEVSFLFAADAGVFVSASAGNSGPTASTVAHPSPWITTVAAGTHNRSVSGSVDLGNGDSYVGASIAASAVSAPLVNSTAVGASGATADEVRLCYSSIDGGLALDPALVAGKIVVCERGVTARVNKSLAVQEAGGVGMILVNTSTNSINADLHYVPTVHLDADAKDAVETYAATAGATATINQATISYRHAGAVHGGVLLAWPAHRGWRQRPQARPDGPRPGHPGGGLAGQSTARTSTSTAVPRCRLRTSPVWPRCCATSTPTGRRWRSSRR